MVSDLREDMEMLLNDKKLLERYKAAAKQRSKQFDVNQFCAELMHTLESVAIV